MILTSSAGIISAKILRDAIEEKTGVRLLVTKNPEKVKRLHIRYGNPSFTNCTDTDYNSINFIKMAVNKKLFAEIIREDLLYDTPKFRKDYPYKDDYPVLIRETLFGYGGKGIIICENEDIFFENWGEGKYWVRWTYTSSEYRLHVLGGNIVKAYRKSLDHEEPPYPIRNMKNGWVFKKVNPTEEMKEIARIIYEKTGGKFFGLDIGFQPSKNKYFIFEANSSPGLGPNTAKCYADYLINEGVI